MSKKKANQTLLDEIRSETPSLEWKDMLLTGFLGTALVTGAFLLTRYNVARSNEYLIRTGLFIKDIKADKKAFQLPFQTITRLNLAPKSYYFRIHAMSQEKLEFILPVVFTIGPKDSPGHLAAYSKYLLHETDENVEDVVKGIIEGDIRVLAANMSVEEIFKGRAEFTKSIIDHTQVELDTFGLTVFNANIKELQDSPQTKYFSFLAQKISSEAENQAKIDIAEARKTGNIGEKEREGSTRQKLAEVEAQTIIFENERKNLTEKSNAELEQRRALYQQQVQIAKLESELNAVKRSEELQKEVELKRLEREIEQRRASELSKARVEAEIKSADAGGEAAAWKVLADAHLYTRIKQADAELYVQMKEAEGIKALYEAQAEGLKKISETFNGDTRALLNYLMIERDLYPKLADASAQAIQGLNPKITIWNTGSQQNQVEKTKEDGLIGNILGLLEGVSDIGRQSDVTNKIKDEGKNKISI